MIIDYHKMVSHFIDFLYSPHAIAGSCIASWFLTSTSLTDIIDHPMKSIFWPLLFGGIAGKWIADVTPDSFEPYVAGGILTLTFAGFVAKKFGLIKKPKSVDWPEVILTLLNRELNKLKISYTAHSVLNEKGVYIDIDRPFTANYIKEILTNNLARLDPKVLESLDNTISIIKDNEYLNQLSGIFIHGVDKGYVMITGPNKESRQVLSIRI
ncbi:Hypothetical protein HVR_LOCUS120 [uncultured virus]|nr:Hypothetical protein HVR_LOCUS120 [uncultured virus]